MRILSNRKEFNKSSGILLLRKTVKYQPSLNNLIYSTSSYRTHKVYIIYFIYQRNQIKLLKNSKYIKEIQKKKKKMKNKKIKIKIWDLLKMLDLVNYTKRELLCNPLIY